VLTLSGNGRLTKTPELRHTDSGKAVTTVSVASSRRDRGADPVYVDLILWDAQAAFAVKHLVKGQAVAFSGRLDPRAWEARDGQQRLALEVHGVDIEYGSKPRDDESTGDPVDDVVDA
jgi:single-strand DNA-binding protein